MSLYSQNRLANVSAIGEKFIFSKFLEPVSEEQMQKDLDEIDAWLEADDAAAQAKLDKELEKQAKDADNNESCKGNESCKESTEEVEEACKEEAGKEEAKTDDKNESCKGNEACKENAEEKEDKAEDKKDDKNESCKESVDSVDEATAAQTRQSKIVQDGLKKGMKNNKTAAGARTATPLTRKASDKIDPNMEISKKLVKKESANEYKLDGKKLAREAVEEWYNENGYEITDYERGRIDMFVESVVNEGKLKKMSKNYTKATKLAAKATSTADQNKQDLALNKLKRLQNKNEKLKEKVDKKVDEITDNGNVHSEKQNSKKARAEQIYNDTNNIVNDTSNKISNRSLKKVSK